ncbi:hypothetical protein K469DRAFT_633297 [Zopfia rhizophila CBS 207.26]|uniref:Thioesterase/thiol ester dehydrase-isomerase n=1 Tax=Zopfia rhizophila CBS 207.26 TaxID=1314779 RepID=A0A6A6DY24_9PEZI|nr:hypothetical protein K469DRAFT_633297 [Zopfia rhizophila CBS 207.26]
MPSYACCTRAVPKTPLHRTQWHRITPQTTQFLLWSSSDTPSNPRWFQDLRSQMLERDFSLLPDYLIPTHHSKLDGTLASFLPSRWTDRTSNLLPLGHHLIFFNPALPSHRLLPDGTDPLQSPGAPFVRRMWAGGSLKVNMNLYFHDQKGMYLSPKRWVCYERIKDVSMRGSSEEDAKIFVTIERRFARMGRLLPRTTWGKDFAEAEQLAKQKLAAGAKDTDGFGEAVLVEERNIVFMKERSASELESIRAGLTMPVKYLDPPGEPDFSHTLTPTPSLLFRYSALTFNAHAIHLDPHYCRTVEGHRNLLFHGPLSLTLMLTLLNNHLKTHHPTQTIQSIDYRNLAPLYCSEQMRLCGRKKDDRTYELWVEGPTGGMAVKGTARTAPIPENTTSASGEAETAADPEDYDWWGTITGEPSSSSEASEDLAHPPRAKKGNALVRSFHSNYSSFANSGVRRIDNTVPRSHASRLWSRQKGPETVRASIRRVPGLKAGGRGAASFNRGAYPVAERGA